MHEGHKLEAEVLRLEESGRQAKAWFAIADKQLRDAERQTDGLRKKEQEQEDAAKRRAAELAGSLKAEESNVSDVDQKLRLERLRCERLEEQAEQAERTAQEEAAEAKARRRLEERVEQVEQQAREDAAAAKAQIEACEAAAEGKSHNNTSWWSRGLHDIVVEWRMG